MFLCIYAFSLLFLTIFDWFGSIELISSFGDIRNLWSLILIGVLGLLCWLGFGNTRVDTRLRGGIALSTGWMIASFLPGDHASIASLLLVN